MYQCVHYTKTFVTCWIFSIKPKFKKEGSFCPFNRLFHLLDDLGVQDITSMVGYDHADVVLEIYPVAALAAHQPETGFEQEFFRFGSGQARQFRQRTPQGWK